ncbi:MAG: hypothetical protein OXL34_00165 [Gemmatimonadota bacterium]|nr:hypothetical protein [Gemmatimonadota bacterium]
MKRRESSFANVGGVATVLLGISLWQGFAPGQERDCKLVGVGGYTESRRQDSVNYTHRASGGIDYRCTDGTRVLADSAVVWEHSGNAYFFGNVHFEDPDTELNADSARYWDNTQELIAYSNVVLTDRKGGAVIRGQTLSYLSESRFRKEDRIVVYGGSPRAVVYPARRPAAPAPVAEAGGDGTEEAEGDTEEVDAAPGSLTAEGMDSAGERLGDRVEDAAADSLAGETEAPAADTLEEQAGAATDSTVEEAEAPGEDSLEVAADDPVIDSMTGANPDQPPVTGLEGGFPELARLDSLAGLLPEPSEEGGAESGEEAAPADAPVDSVTPLPYEVEAPRIMIDGRRFFRAGGGVVVTRDSLRAVGDSLDYDQEVGAMLILGGASVEDSGFQLKGLSVSMTPTAGLNEEILAREEAVLTGDDVLMTAPAIRLFLEDGKVGRLVALPTVPPLPGDGAEALDTTGLTPGDAARVRAMAEAAAAAAAEEDSLNAPDSLPRPSVVAAQFNLTGDSIEVLSPGQVLDVVTAVGAARADAMDQDSVIHQDLPEIARNDWMEGETIIARFVSAESEGDSTAGDPGPAGRRARLETLTAITDARSFYRLHSADTTQAEADTSDLAPVAADEPGPPPEGLAEAREDSTTATDEPDPPREDSVTAADEPDPPREDSTTAADEPDPPQEENGSTPPECDTTGIDGERRPELHYVSGNQITIFLEGRKVVKMEVTGRTMGYHFEPVRPDCESAAADSAVSADSVATPTDTTTPPPDTVRPPPPPRSTTSAPGYALSDPPARRRNTLRDRPTMRPRRAARLTHSIRSTGGHG